MTMLRLVGLEIILSFVIISAFQCFRFFKVGEEKISVKMKKKKREKCDGKLLSNENINETTLQGQIKMYICDEQYHSAKQTYCCFY